MATTPETTYRLLVEAVADYAICMLDVDGSVLTWNRGAERCKGYSADEVLGTHFERFYTGEDRAAGMPALALQRAVTDGRFEGEGWRVRKDGSRFLAHVVIDPIRDDDGELVGFAQVTRDLTEQQATQASQRRNEAQFQMLVQGVSDYAIYMLDVGGHVSNWNSGAQRIKGYAPEEIVGKHFSCFYTDEDREKGEPQRNLQITTREGRVESEGWRVRKDGSRFWAHVLIDRILDDDGQLAGFAKVTRDVTEQRHTALELERAREALFQSQKLESIGQLTGGVAHDFNNLLMAVISSLELLRSRVPDEPKTRMLIENALAGAFRGAALTQRMLAFARRQELRPTTVDLVTLVRGMSDLLQRSLGSHIAISTTFPLTLEPVMVDPNQLELALMNLAVNARDAMPDGGQVSIAASREHVEAGHPAKLPVGDYVCLAVTDQGEGMDETTLLRATEPFFTTKGVGKGTGLGLSMVHGLAEQSGGRLMMSSTPGEGTRMEIWLPAAPITKSTTAANAPVAIAAAPKTEPLRILAVDDDDLVLATLSAQLEELGHQVVMATSAADALVLLGQGATFDLVITDHAMPGMTGSQFAMQLRSERPGLPIVLATGFAELPRELKLDVLRLKKPFSQQDLAGIIAKAVPDRRAA